MSASPLPNTRITAATRTIAVASSGTRRERTSAAAAAERDRETQDGVHRRQQRSPRSRRRCRPLAADEHADDGRERNKRHDEHRSPAPRETETDHDAGEQQCEQQARCRRRARHPTQVAAHRDVLPSVLERDDPVRDEVHTPGGVAHDRGLGRPHPVDPVVVPRHRAPASGPSPLRRGVGVVRRRRDRRDRLLAIEEHGRRARVLVHAPRPTRR